MLRRCKFGASVFPAVVKDTFCNIKTATFTGRALVDNSFATLSLGFVSDASKSAQSISFYGSSEALIYKVLI